MSHAAVVVPIKEGSRERVRELLAGGPPFDPDSAGLVRQEVFLTDREAVFVVESEMHSTLDRVAADLGEAAAAWQEHAAGPPRLAESIYFSVQSAFDPELFSGPTPGPGDSEGGDVYAP